MKKLIGVVAAVLIGVLLGLLYTGSSLDRIDRDPVAGPWRAMPRDYAGAINPYALATIERDGLLPLGAAEGLSFLTETDSKGSTLSAACDYVVKGPMPTARFWTLSLLSPSGFPIANAANRYGFTSSEVLRLNDRRVVVSVSSKVRSGNWLPVGKTSSFVLMLRLYDTGLSTVGTTLNAITMPVVEKGACR